MSEHSPGAFRGLWLRLRRPSAKWSVLALLVVGGISGIIFWGGFNTGLEATNSLEFCIGCHEMRDNVYQEYKETVHYTNRFGVRAICSDCHVPHDWTAKIIRKIKASREVYGKLTGYIDTSEKFETHRMEMATREWARMKSRNSLECRNCHSFDAMDSNEQSQTIFRKHTQAKDSGQTCIDCHKGIAHHLPKEYHDPNEDE
jgi:cytochrome c-type protein NapC